MGFIKWNNYLDRRKKAAVYFLVFLVLMVLCTIISRGIYAYHMPRVEIGTAGQRNLSHTVRADGRIEAGKETAVVVEAGIRVKEISVRAGEKVEEGTVLLWLDTSDLTKLCEKVSGEIQVRKQKLSVLKANKSLEEQTARTTEERAKEDLENARKAQEKAVDKAKEDCQDAGSALASYPSWEAYLEAAKAADGGYQKRKEEAEEEGALPEAKAEFAEYEEKLAQTAKTAWEEGKREIESRLAEKESALAAARAERDKTVGQAGRAAEDAEKKAPADVSGILEEENALAQMEEKLAIYRKLLEQEGAVFSETKGNVSAVCLTVGDRTTDSAAVILADSTQGWNFRAALSPEQAAYVRTGGTVTLKFQREALSIENCQVTAVTETEEGGYEANVKVTEQGLSLGESGTLEVTEQTGSYSCCIPLSALYAENDRNYVLLIRETETILGTELSVIKREVSVRDKNESYAALEEGSLGSEEEVVVFSSKGITPGDTVRLLEEEDG